MNLPNRIIPNNILYITICIISPPPPGGSLIPPLRLWDLETHFQGYLSGTVGLSVQFSVSAETMISEGWD